jgi:hypothetical protein
VTFSADSRQLSRYPGAVHRDKVEKSIPQRESFYVFPALSAFFASIRYDDRTRFGDQPSTAAPENAFSLKSFGGHKPFVSHRNQCS